MNRFTGELGGRFEPQFGQIPFHESAFEQQAEQCCGTFQFFLSTIPAGITCTCNAISSCLDAIKAEWKFITSLTASSESAAAFVGGSSSNSLRVFSASFSNHFFDSWDNVLSNHRDEIRSAVGKVMFSNDSSLAKDSAQWANKSLDSYLLCR